MGEFEYAIEGVTKIGEYHLSAMVVTNNPDQSIQVSINGGPDITLKMPFTLGKWEKTKPRLISLQEGTNTLRFKRANAPQYSVAVKSFTLEPFAATAAEAAAAKRRSSPASEITESA